MLHSDSDEVARWGITLLYVFLVLSLVFKVEFTFEPLQAVSRFASINSEDMAILLLGVTVAGQHLRDRDRPFKLVLPGFSSLFVLLSVWIFITVLVAMFRSPQPVTASLFWVVKSLEVLIFFLLIQQHLDRNLGRVVLRILVFSGIIVSIVVLTLVALGVKRPGPFFGNPNALSSFLMVVALMPLSKAYVAESSRDFVTNGLLALIPILAIVSTISRGGILGLGVGVIVLTGLLYQDLSGRKIAGFAVTAVGILASIPFVIGASGIKRLTEWVTFEDGRLILADSAAAQSFQIRIALLEKGFELFKAQPIFGHGWYAAPSRVGWLDIYYTVIPVELGIVGLVLFGIFHTAIFKRMWFIRGQGVLAMGSAVFAWQAGLLAQAVAGPFLRVPHVMFILLLTLTAVWALREEYPSEVDRLGAV